MSKPRDADTLIKLLKARGGSAKKSTIIGLLGWPEDKYLRAFSKLSDEGKIEVKQGGSIHISQQILYKKEAHLYNPLKEAIAKNWGDDWRADELIVEVTAKSGKPSMGRWSRPDLCAVSLKHHEFLGRKQVDLWTFEVKPTRTMSVDNVLEAVAHSRFSHKTYIMFHVDATIDNNRFSLCLDEAERHGIGLVTFKDPIKYFEWTWHREAARKDPDPGYLNDFMQGLPPPMRQQILKWLK